MEVGDNINQYQVVEHIGRGGMAVVYLADDRKHLRRVAVKVLADELVGQLSCRFLAEARSAAMRSATLRFFKIFSTPSRRSSRARP